MKKQLAIIFLAMLACVCLAACGSEDYYEPVYQTPVTDNYADDTGYYDDVDEWYEEELITPTPTSTPSPTSTTTPSPTPTPLLTDKVCEKLTGQKWKMEAAPYRTDYGEPVAIIIESIDRETATVKYIINQYSIYKSECIGLQYGDGNYFVMLECTVKEDMDSGTIILTSKLQDREFNSVSNSKDPLCVIEMKASNVKEMTCTFYGWERELVMVESLPEILVSYQGTIYHDLNSIAVFSEMAAAVTNDHKLYMWGSRALNYVADNPVKGTAIEPTFVLEGVKEIYPGSRGSGLVIMEDNSLWGFGDYSEYAVWDENLDFYERKARENYVNKIADDVKSVSCDGNITAYVCEDGTVVVLEEAIYCSKKRVENITDVKELHYGSDFVLALKEDGTLWGLGDNRDEVLGIEGNAEYLTSYVQIMSDVVAVETSGSNTFVIKSDGSLWGWGSNKSGQLGQWDFGERKLPVKIMDSVEAVSCHGGTVFAITKDASLYAWGGSSPISAESNHPVKCMAGVIGVEEYMGVLMVVKSDGALYTAGYNSNKQLGYMTDDSRTTKLKKCLDNILLPGENE